VLLSDMSLMTLWVEQLCTSVFRSISLCPCVCVCVCVCAYLLA